MTYKRKNRLSAEEYINGILEGNKMFLSRAITLTESMLREDNLIAAKILEGVIHKTGNSLRIGITGVPGVGKSTFIESFGLHLTSANKKVAVLAIDPSSQKSKGSILGDKTRMETLAHNPHAFIRPSATGTTLGGVAHKTREALLLCEAAGFDIILIETVGVGQSETAVKKMVDFFLLLMLAGAGDELQGIKKGIMEMADLVVINKADGNNTKAAMTAKRDYQNALHLFPGNANGWKTEVMVASGLQKTGMENIWKNILSYEGCVKKNGYFIRNRQQQNLNWMEEIIFNELEQRFIRNKDVKAAFPDIKTQVIDGKLPAVQAAKKMLDLYFESGA